MGGRGSLRDIHCVNFVNQPLRVLCLDIEGGHGGSSRSLLNALEAICRDDIHPEVICRRGGWVEDAYADNGIACDVDSSMPTFTALDRESRNLFDGLDFLIRRWPHSRAFRRKLLKRAQGVDLVHCNHISLFLLARWLKQQLPRLILTMHIRTQPEATHTARWQARIAAKYCDGLIYITENEHDCFAKLAPDRKRAHEQVIYNPVQVVNLDLPISLQHHPSIPRDGRLIVLSLSNFAYARGGDRLIEIARALPSGYEKKIHFVVAGDMHLTGKLPAELHRVTARGGTLADYAEERGLSDHFLFLGHVDDPTSVLVSSDVLLKPTRGHNPWGRDVLEAMSHGLPVASVGHYKTFVETNLTGLLQEVFDANAVANWLVELYKDAERLSVLGQNAKDRILKLCNPITQAADLADFWKRVSANSDHIAHRLGNPDPS
jgi:glycosyltransferase involved in cell wall biosynthesis